MVITYQHLHTSTFNVSKIVFESDPQMLECHPQPASSLTNQKVYCRLWP